MSNGNEQHRTTRHIDRWGPFGAGITIVFGGTAAAGGLETALVVVGSGLVLFALRPTKAMLRRLRRKLARNGVETPKRGEARAAQQAAIEPVTPEPPRLPTPEPTPSQQLRGVLQSGRLLRTELVAAPDGVWNGETFVPTDKVPTSEDRVYLWARRALDTIEEVAPEFADDFMGEDAPMGRGYFMLAFSNDVRQMGGRQEYLESRLRILRQAIAADHTLAPAAA